MSSVKIHPHPHANIVCLKNKGKLSALVDSLVKTDLTDLTTQIELAKTPINKFAVKYIHGSRIVTIKPAYVYYLRFNFSDGTELFKIGYTSMSVRKRIAFFMLAASTKVTIIETIKCGNAKEAFKLEQLLHLNFKPLRYYGENKLNSGNTELYRCSLL